MDGGWTDREKVEGERETGSYRGIKRQMCSQISHFELVNCVNFSSKVSHFPC